MISIFNDNIIGFPLTPMGILGSKCITPNRSVKKVCHRRGSVFQVPVRDSCHVGESQEPNTSSHYFNDTRPRLMRKVTQQQGLWFPFTTAVTPPHLACKGEEISPVWTSLESCARVQKGQKNAQSIWGHLSHVWSCLCIQCSLQTHNAPCSQLHASASCHWCAPQVCNVISLGEGTLSCGSSTMKMSLVKGDIIPVDLFWVDSWLKVEFDRWEERGERPEQEGGAKSDERPCVSDTGRRVLQRARVGLDFLPSLDWASAFQVAFRKVFEAATFLLAVTTTTPRTKTW